MADMTEEQVRQIVLETLDSEGAHTAEVPTATDGEIATGVTLPILVGNGSLANYRKMTVAKLAEVVAGDIDPEEAFPTKLDSITEDELDAIFPLSSSSSSD